MNTTLTLNSSVSFLLWFRKCGVLVTWEMGKKSPVPLYSNPVPLFLGLHPSVEESLDNRRVSTATVRDLERERSALRDSCWFRNGLLEACRDLESTSSSSRWPGFSDGGQGDTERTESAAICSQNCAVFETMLVLLNFSSSSEAEDFWRCSAPLEPHS